MTLGEEKPECDGWSGRNWREPPHQLLSSDSHFKCMFMLHYKAINVHFYRCYCEIRIVYNWKTFQWLHVFQGRTKAQFRLKWCFVSIMYNWIWKTMLSLCLVLTQFIRQEQISNHIWEIDKNPLVHCSIFCVDFNTQYFIDTFFKVYLFFS